MLFPGRLCGARTPNQYASNDFVSTTREGKKSSSQFKPQMAAQALSITGCIPSLRCQSLFTRDSTAMFEWHLMGGKRLRLFMHTTQGQAFHVFAASNGSSAEGNPDKEIVMVDPLEAKRLAAKQMQEIKAKERFKKRRQIEAINGAWAIIGLTAGLVIEGHTGKSIVGQLAEYLRAIVRFFVR